MLITQWVMTWVKNPLHRMEQRELTVEGVRIRAHELWHLDAREAATPDLPTFVLVHGLGVSSKFFVPLAERLATRGRVVLFDLPGFAGLPKPKERLSIEDFAAIVGGALDQLRVPGAPVFVGHSMGAQVVAELLAVRHPGARAMLIAPVVNAQERTMPTLVRRFAQSAIRESPANAGAAAAAYLRCGPRWFTEILPELLQYPIERRLDGLPASVVLVGGVNDRVSPPEWQLQLAGELSQARVITIPEAAHGLVFDHADRLAGELLDLVGLPLTEDETT